MGDTHTRSVTILLDGVVVCTAKQSASLVSYEALLNELSNGRHVARFEVLYDSGDAHISERVFEVAHPDASPTERRTVFKIKTNGSGNASASVRTQWFVDESVQLPLKLTLRGSTNSRLFVQLPGNIEKWTVERGKVSVELTGRSFAVSTDTVGRSEHYELIARLPESPRLLWTIQPSSPAFYALIVGISIYRHIGSLSFCDEDAVAWATFLSSRGRYDVRVLGDGESNYQPFSPAAVATEANIRSYLQALTSVVRENDTVVFVNSGHGCGDGRGYSWICCVDECGEKNGQLDDNELSQDLAALVDLGVNVIAFMDCCYSGGLIDNMERRCKQPSSWYMCTTCTKSGFGFDDDQTSHGAWTHAYLVNGLQKRFTDQNPTVGEVYQYADSIYTHGQQAKNRPCFGGNPSLRFLA